MPFADPPHVARAVAALREFSPAPGRSLDDRQAEALAVIYRGYARKLLVVARRIVATETDAEDVIHDVFSRLPRILHQCRGACLGAWLRRVTQRTALMQLRSARRRREHRLVADLSHGEFEPNDSATPGIRDMLDDALAELAEPLREIVVLRMYLDYSHREIADALDISPTASEVKLCRAMKRLREGLRHSRPPQLRRSA